MDLGIDWKKALLKSDATLQHAISNLNETGYQIVLVISDDGQLQGTITDGDVRRGLLRGLNLQSAVEGIINRDALVVPPDMQRELVLHLLKANKIHQIPIVDGERRVIGLHLMDALSVPMTRPNRMIIMAGGLGTRLRPYTETCPKPLLPVAGKPMLEHIIERAKNDGFEYFTLAIHYLGHMIEDYFGNGELWQVNIDYIKEQSPLGTAGALSLLSTKPDKPFLISNGDILSGIRYGELLDFHVHHNAMATMAVRQHEWQHPFGVVQTKGVDIIGFNEKPISRTYVNAGVYVLEPSVLDLLNSNDHCDMPSVFEKLRKQACRTVVYPIHEPWLDVGEPKALAMANITEEKVE